MDLVGQRTAEYVVCGSWAEKALAEARKIGATRRLGRRRRLLHDGADLGALGLDPSAAYLHDK